MILIKKILMKKILMKKIQMKRIEYRKKVRKFLGHHEGYKVPFPEI